MKDERRKSKEKGRRDERKKGKKGKGGAVNEGKD